LRRDRRSLHQPFTRAERETYLLEVSLGQVRQNVGVNFVLAEGRFVLAEVETLQPLAEVHGGTPHGFTG
jgi:hypothetical protein